MIKHRIVIKRGWFWRLIGWFVKVFTFGRNRVFMSQYITTIGPVIAVPRGWMYDAATIDHELVHVRQFRWCGLGSAYSGIPLMLVLYVLLLPVGFCPGRFFMELFAYVHNVKAIAKERGQKEAKRYIQHIVNNHLTGSNYGWPMPPLKFIRKFATRFYEKRLER